jgi:hypothetical protein
VPISLRPSSQGLQPRATALVRRTARVIDGLAAGGYQASSALHDSHAQLPWQRCAEILAERSVSCGPRHVLASYEAGTPSEVLELREAKIHFVVIRQNMDLHLGVSEFVFESALSSARSWIPSDTQA